MEKLTESDFEELHELLKIDQNALDEALSMQADLYYRVAEACAYAASRRDAAYEAIKETDARLNMEIRQNLENEGEKVTEGRVQAMVLEDSDHRDAVQHHLECKLEYDRLTALRDSFSQRNYMIRGMVDMYGMGYFMDSEGRANPTTASGHHAEYRRTREKLSDARRKRKAS